MVQTFVKRPTSPLRFEPVETSPEHLLWPGSDDEADEDEREKKRVRIEELGKQYLEGRPLFIQSAGLRGPFDQGWINPWACKDRVFEKVNHRSNVAPKAAEAATYNQAEAERGLSRAKRRSVTDAEIGPSTDRLASEVILEDSRVKRRRLEEAAGPMWQNKQENLGAILSKPTAPSLETGTRAPLAREEAGYRDPWLKTDPKFLRSRSNDDVPSSTPTPVVRPRSKPREDAVPHQKPPVTVVDLPKAQDSEVRQSKDVQAMGSTYLDRIPASGDKEEPRPQSTKYPPEPAPNSDAQNEPHQSPRTHVRTISISKADPYTKNGYAAVKRLSQEAVNRLEYRRADSGKPSQEAVSGASQNTGKPTPTRLAPYISDFDLRNDAATSAGHKAVKKGPTPKPSPHAAPASTDLPEFQYRYAIKGSASNASKSVRSLVQALQGPPLRRRSESASSSGSSDFVKEFEAAQAKAGSKSLGSSYSSSPIRERHETTSVQKNTQAMRRLTFTASGEPRIANNRESSRPSSRSSAAKPPAPVSKRGDSMSEKSEKNAPVRKASTKSSDVLFTNGNVSRNSVVLPEAQVVSDAPVQVAQLPSESSTNLLETDKQSPKFISLDDEDSYLDLSTQAAMQKAQRSFKDDILSPVKIKVSPSQKRSPENLKHLRTDITPTANGRSARAADNKFVKPELEDDEEPMSTQAMADAISPFAVTTIKKRPPAFEKGAAFAPSPTRARSPSAPKILSPDPSPTGFFHKPLSMSTTPSTSQPPQSQPNPTPPIPLSRPHTSSKPPSALTSFSMLPNGTMTESSSIFQDGQRSQHDFDVSLPLDPFGTPFGTADGNGNQSHGSWDLNAAIEEAGNFLGDWDVEAEARKEGDKRRKKKEVGMKGILSVGKGNS